MPRPAASSRARRPRAGLARLTRAAQGGTKRVRCAAFRARGGVRSRATPTRATEEEIEMAQHKSAEKRHRQSLKRRARNRHYRAGVRNAVRGARAAAESKAPEAASSVKDAE